MMGKSDRKPELMLEWESNESLSAVLQQVHAMTLPVLRT